MPGRMDAARASPMSARMAVSREQDDHPLVPRSVTTAAPDATAACQSLSPWTRWTQQLFSRTNPAGDPAGSGTGALVSPADGTSAPPAGRHMHADFSAHAAWTPAAPDDHRGSDAPEPPICSVLRSSASVTHGAQNRSIRCAPDARSRKACQTWAEQWRRDHLTSILTSWCL